MVDNHKTKHFITKSVSIDVENAENVENVEILESRQLSTCSFKSEIGPDIFLYV